MNSKKIQWILRIAMGWIFLWAFLDKVLGLGFATTPERSWLAGGSPTSGFLTGAVKGPFAELYHALAGSTVVDWLFMMGLLLIGLGLITGMKLKLACYGGVALMILMYLALVPPANNPIIDEHIIYALVLLVLARTD
ncbi:MAG: hypothetical protein U1C57_01290 [Candidatus Doudnabacteria bacterium]|nr:hypothetical protein [bacterium]MDZ4243717.1 hypothetical protein [Candidatus Doudnabacteria bacterium]